MAHITYQELVEIYGQKAAYALLRAVEKSSYIETSIISSLDLNERLNCAFGAMLDQAGAA